MHCSKSADLLIYWENGTAIIAKKMQISQNPHMNATTSNVFLSGLRENHPWAWMKSSKVPSGWMLSNHDTRRCITSSAISSLLLDGKPQEGLILKKRLNRISRWYCWPSGTVMEIQSSHEGITFTMSSLRKENSSIWYAFTHLSTYNMIHNKIVSGTRRHPWLINAICACKKQSQGPNEATQSSRLNSLVQKSISSNTHGTSSGLAWKRLVRCAKRILCCASELVSCIHAIQAFSAEVFNWCFWTFCDGIAAVQSRKKSGWGGKYNKWDYIS